MLVLEERIVMKTNEEEDSRHIFRGELALVISSHDQQSCCYSDAVFWFRNIHISSVPYAFEKVFPVITLGTWTSYFSVHF